MRRARRRLSPRMLELARWYSTGRQPRRPLTRDEAIAKWREGLADWEARTGRSALAEALASLTADVRYSRRVQRNAQAIRDRDSRPLSSGRDAAVSYPAPPNSACTLSDEDLVHRYCVGVTNGAAKLALTIGPDAAENYRRRSIEQAQRYVHNHRLYESVVRQQLDGHKEGDPEGSPIEPSAQGKCTA